MTFSVQRSAFSVQPYRSTFNVQRSASKYFASHATRSTQHATRSTQHATRSTQHAAHSTQHGFTLLELAVIIVIISMAAIIVLPILPSSDAANLRSSARRLSAVIRYLGDQAVTTKSVYRMQLDMTDNAVTVKKIVGGEETAPEDPFFSRKILAEGVSIEDVEVPRLGKTSEGVVNADFGVAGLGEFTVIHLKGEKEGHFTITAFPNGGKVNVREGYQETLQ